MREATTESGPSAGQILMRAGQQTTQPDQDKGEEHRDEEKTTKRQEANQDPLETGDRVFVKHQIRGRWNKEAEIIEQREDKLSCVIKDDTEQILVRGRRLLKSKPAPAKSDCYAAWSDKRPNWKHRNKKIHKSLQVHPPSHSTRHQTIHLTTHRQHPGQE